MPTTLEADVLKLRAFEMVLILFYMEDLKRFIIACIEATDEFDGVSRLNPKKNKKMESAREILVAEGAITQAESDELYTLMNYRNSIGHYIHDLTVDVGAYSDLVHLDPKTDKPIHEYDYTAAKRAAQLKKKVEDGMGQAFTLVASMDFLKFEAAERVYLTEIKRLKVKVNKGVRQLRKVFSDTNAVIKSIPRTVLDSAQPGHPRNIKDNGTLSKHGADCIFQLYDANATPLAAAYMMRLSTRSATTWRKKWEAAKDQR
ncbi:hypothetical protein D3C84_757210 [compost metagenome]